MRHTFRLNGREQGALGLQLEPKERRRLMDIRGISRRDLLRQGSIAMAGLAFLHPPGWLRHSRAGRARRSFRGWISRQPTLRRP
jgi:hypothetical protein